MKCPHCHEHFIVDPIETSLGDDFMGRWWLRKDMCAACNKFIFHFEMKKWLNERRRDFVGGIKIFMVVPKGVSRSPLPSVVPTKYSEDYLEACLVLADSPKASSALSRRCLQNILREVEKVKRGSLADEIQEVMDKGKLPTHLLEGIDAIRNIGNFSAHPIKSKSTGEIVPVELGEAEWNLDILESLFDYYFVQPEILKKKKEALNKKLEEAGKPEMKQPKKEK